MATGSIDGKRNFSAAARHWNIVLALLALAAAVGCEPASAFLVRPILFAAVDGPTKAPRGWLQFCADNPTECRPAADPTANVTLTPELLEQLYSINPYANDRVVWTADSELYGKDEHWALPLDRGDCEDIALLNRQLLAKAGWPIAALLITVAEDPKISGVRPAVLTVHTDKGEIILDNLTPEILFWYETSYHFLTRQSATDPNVWVAFSGTQPRPVSITAAK